jgi:pimeloyl-ACP methyl ester carboxylesterase
LTDRSARAHDRPTLTYLHGFASGPGSTKARFFAAHLAARGAKLRVPDLAPDFTHQTITGMLGLVDALLDEAPSVLLGSSLGGYLAALAAARRPTRVPGLVLFAPAFGFAARWEERVGAETMKRWRERGTAPVHHYGVGRELPLSIDLLDDARRHPPAPDSRVPTLVFAGRRDESVPLADVERWVAGRPRCELVVYDSGHELTDVLDPMWGRTVRFLADLDALE